MWCGRSFVPGIFGFALERGCVLACGELHHEVEVSVDVLHAHDALTAVDLHAIELDNSNMADRSVVMPLNIEVADETVGIRSKRGDPFEFIDAVFHDTMVASDRRPEQNRVTDFTLRVHTEFWFVVVQTGTSLGVVGEPFVSTGHQVPEANLSFPAFGVWHEQLVKVILHQSTMARESRVDAIEHAATNTSKPRAVPPFMAVHLAGQAACTHSVTNLHHPVLVMIGHKSTDAKQMSNGSVRRVCHSDIEDLTVVVAAVGGAVHRNDARKLCEECR